MIKRPQGIQFVLIKEPMKSFCPHPSYQLRAHLLTRHFSAAFFKAVVPLFYVRAAQQRHLFLAVLPHKRVTTLKRIEQCQHLEGPRAETNPK